MVKAGKVGAGTGCRAARWGEAPGKVHHPAECAAVCLAAVGPPAGSIPWQSYPASRPAAIPAGRAWALAQPLGRFPPPCRLPAGAVHRCVQRDQLRRDALHPGAQGGAFCSAAGQAVAAGHAPSRAEPSVHVASRGRSPAICRLRSRSACFVPSSHYARCAPAQAAVPC